VSVDVLENDVADLPEPEGVAEAIALVIRTSLILISRPTSTGAQSSDPGESGRTDQRRRRAALAQADAEGERETPRCSNLYLNEVDRMLEKEIEYARFADDLVILIHADPSTRWLLTAVDK
jgi:hypothetical protein